MALAQTETPTLKVVDENQIDTSMNNQDTMNTSTEDKTLIEDSATSSEETSDESASSNTRQDIRRWDSDPELRNFLFGLS